MRRKITGRKAIVQLAAYSCGGTVVADRRDAITLTDATIVDERGGTSPIDGEVVIPRAWILWVQLP